MSHAPHIVSTRKLTSAKVDDLSVAGWKFTDHDFISKAISVPAELDARSIHNFIVLTSITGVKAFLQIVKHLNLNREDYIVYCISRGTKEYAAASKVNIKSTASTASALADEILHDVEVKAVTYIGSNLRREELSEKLKNAGVLVHDVIAYRTAFTPMAITESYEGIVFFSPSAVDSFLSSNPLKQVPCFCIGQTTADYAKQCGYKN